MLPKAALNVKKRLLPFALEVRFPDFFEKLAFILKSELPLEESSNNNSVKSLCIFDNSLV